jgi:UDPglucose 6-dehydrogenase
VAELLLGRGIEVVGYDPHAGTNAAAALPGLRVVATASEALRGSSVAVIGTEWPEFRQLDWRALGPTMASQVVIDGRRLLDGPAIRSLGFRYEAVGAADVPQVDRTRKSAGAGS